MNPRTEGVASTTQLTLYLQRVDQPPPPAALDHAGRIYREMLDDTTVGAQLERCAELAETEGERAELARVREIHDEATAMCSSLLEVLAALRHTTEA